MNKACVMSGYCCTTAPCVYGKAMDDEQIKVKMEDVGCRVNKTECLHLLPPNHMGQRFCGIYDEIKEAEDMSDFPYPMMGSGCGSRLFNVTRTQILERMENKDESTES